MRDRQNCIGCGKLSPETETNYTLISAQFGWRLAKRQGPAGEFIVEWRCAECWREHKKKTTTSGDEAPLATVAKPGSGDRARATPPSSRDAEGVRSSRPPRPRTPSKPPSLQSSPATRKRP
jgi:hypothetical protein